ncbi:MAG TPA: hypothetical protein VN786_12170 [Acidimicrobiales bacterium]|nr:hypothetical protein [Acidimicrobiales bacterium]
MPALVPFSREDGLAHKEGSEARYQPDQKGGAGEDGGLGGENGLSLGHGDEGGADRARAVLGRYDEHAEYGDGQLGQEDPVQAERNGMKAGLFGRAQVAVAVDVHRAQQCGQADHGRRGGEQGPVRGADAAQLGPFRAQKIRGERPCRGGAEPG